jgi:hypothetical protein
MESRSVLQSNLDLVDFTAVRAPFLVKTLTKWRRQYWDTLPKTQATVTWLDSEMTAQVLTKVEARYFAELAESDCAARDFGLPAKVIDDLRSHQDYLQLAALMARWAMELEQAWDILDRAQLYGMYTIPRKHHEAFGELRTAWAVSDKQLKDKLSSFSANLLGRGAETVASKVQKSMESTGVHSLISAKSSLIYGFIHAYLSGKVPWAVLAMVGTSASWVLGGMLVLKLGHSVHARLSSAQLSEFIRHLTINFERLIDKLSSLNAVASRLLIDEFGNSDCEELKMVLDKLFERKHMEFSQFFDEETYLGHHIRVSEEEDYILVSLDDYNSDLLSRPL